MLKTITQNQDMSFYGKTNRGEFAWFVIFMGCLGAGGTSISLYADIRAIFGHKMAIFNIISGLLLTIILMSLTIFVFYVGFLWRWEYVDGGRNAVERFWQRYRRGVLPKLFDVRLHTEKEYGEIGGGDRIVSGYESYVLFHFHENCWHIDIYVLIPQAIFDKIRQIVEKTGYRVEREGDKIEIIFSDGTRTILEGEEIEAYRFLDFLFKTQKDRIYKMETLLKQLKQNRINVYEYVREMWR